MIGLGWAEILILLVCAGIFCGGPLLVALLFFLSQWSRRPTGNVAPQPHPQSVRQALATPMSPADSHLEVVARLTQRFCPRCRTVLAADAPEGLCPACLMAGGLASIGGEADERGLAATALPSGSQPPVAGEWADLQQHFPQLEILELLGRGGMGSVYKARQKNLDRLVALKVIPPEAAKDPAFAERFAREARALARLNHPSIVTVYDFGQTGEVYFLLMEYVDGVNLRHAMRANRLAPREALAIVPPICDALQYAHDQGVVHRDIKPENVLLDRSGRVKIADFGLAKLLGKGPDDYTLTRTQQVMGTPRYMAPEQIEQPAAVDHRADIYSLGVVLYEMLTGELPMGRFEAPSQKVQVDVRIDEVVMRALEKAPDRRYQRASQIKTDLASAASWPPPPGAPLWNTPAPASKFDSSAEAFAPGGAPLGMVLAVAVGMVLGVLLMAAGLALGVLALLQVLPGPLGGWLGAAFGCLVGGFGSAAGSYNTYRQLAGAEDLMRSPRVTWLDWVMRVYLVVGIALLILGSTLTATNGQILLTLGGIATFQAGLFLILRALMRLPAERPALGAATSAARPADPARESIRRRVAGPAIGLIVAGIVGILPLVAAPSMVAAVGVDVRPIAMASLHGANGSPAALPIVLAQFDPGATQTSTKALWFFGLSLSLGGLLSLVTLVGGIQMLRLRWYGLAVVAASLAMFPCSAGWLVGLPMGVWSIVLLMKPEVRDAFES